MYVCVPGTYMYLYLCMCTVLVCTTRVRYVNSKPNCFNDKIDTRLLHCYCETFRFLLFILQEDFITCMLFIYYEETFIFLIFFFQINLPSVFFAVENCVTPSLVVLMYGTTVQRYNGTMVQWYNGTLG